jgi:hypothetical protein
MGKEWALRILILVVIFFVGYFGLTVIKSRGLACLTWLTGVGLVTIYVMFLPLPTPIGIIAGWGVFLFGVVALVVFYIRKPCQ